MTSKRTSLPNTDDSTLSDLPAGWEKKLSKSKRGKHYYYNLELGVSVWRISDIPAYSKLSKKGCSSNQSLPNSHDKHSSAKDEHCGSSLASPSTSTFRPSCNSVADHKPIRLNVRSCNANGKQAPEKTVTSSTSETFGDSHRSSRQATQKKVAVYKRQVKNFDKIVEKSALKSEKILLETPLGSKHGKEKGYVGKLPKGCVGPLPNQKLKKSRYAPFSTTSRKAKPPAVSRSPHNKSVDPLKEDELSTSRISRTETTASVEAAQAAGSYREKSCEDRVLDFVVDDDFEMMSAVDDDEGLSYSLTTDVAMTMDDAFDTFDDHQKKKEHKATVVVDTCSIGSLSQLISISNLKLLDQTAPVKTYKDFGDMKVVIPWQVLQELDVLKDNKNNKFSSSKKRKAAFVVKTINSALTNGHPVLRLQSPLDDAMVLEGYRIQTADDLILKCCLCIKKKRGDGHSVFLVTEDQNLLNKSQACHIRAYKYSDFKRLLPKYISSMPVNAATVPVTLSKAPEVCIETESSAKPMETLEKLRHILSPIIDTFVSYEMEAAFGKMWKEISYHKPPWSSIAKALETMYKHWIAVFGLVLPRHLDKDALKLSRVMASGTKVTMEALSEALVSAVALIRALDQANKSYGADLRDVLNRLTDLIVQFKATANRVAAEPSTSTPAQVDSLPAATGQGLDDSLTRLFTTLAEACQRVDTQQAKQEALDVVWNLGQAYQAALTIPADPSQIINFQHQLLNVARILSLQMDISSEDLGSFIAENHQLLVNGLGQLEQLAMALHSYNPPT